jgi:hypothetical protein
MTFRAPSFQVFERPETAAGPADDVASVHRLECDPLPALRTQVELTEAARSLVKLTADLDNVSPFGG